MSDEPEATGGGYVVISFTQENANFMGKQWGACFKRRS
jgi:hypothetical protein